MSDSNIPSQPGAVPDPRRPHRVVVEFDVRAQSQDEADDIVQGMLIEALASTDELRTENNRVFAVPRGDTSQITSWIQTSHQFSHRRGTTVTSPGWEPFEGSGVPEIVVEMFPPEPQRDDFRLLDGSPDVEGFEVAHEAWRDACLYLAVRASRLPDLLETAEQTKRVRDGLIDVLERERLPVEPQKEDYLVTVAPAYEGEFEQMRFAWDHTQWQANFNAAAQRREHALQGLVADGGPRTAFLPEKFHREWVPADLIAIHALRALVEREKSGPGAPLMDDRQRQQLEAMLFAADPEVLVVDPDDPNHEAMYTGQASEAHNWIPAGVYDAVGVDDTGEFRLVVGRVPVGDGVTASAAFPPAEHDSAVMNEIARILEQDSEHDDPATLLHRVNEAIRGTGRIGAHPAEIAPESQTRLERGALLSDLLADREQHLNPDPEDTKRTDPNPGFGRDM